MLPSSPQTRGCLICGSPDKSCGGHAETEVKAVSTSAPAGKFTGPIIEAIKPGPNGPYRVRARLDEAEARGWKPIMPEPETKAEPEPKKAKPKTKARTAKNKARTAGGDK